MGIIWPMNRIERKTAQPHARTDAARLTGVDLNLLVVLAVLLDEASVTRTAARLGRTQSAISHALDRLRVTLADPLFVRSGREMIPTPRAEGLRAPVAALTAGLSDLLLGAPTFDPARSDRRFRVTASDYVQLVMMTPLVQRLRKMAPGVSLEIHGPKGRLLERLSRDELDFSFMVYLEDQASLHARKLFTDRFVCAVADDHPTVRRKLDRATYLRLPHVLIAPLGGPSGQVDRELARTGEARRIAVLVPDFMMAPRILRGTDLVLTLPERVARLFVSEGVTILEPPIALPAIAAHLVWHERVSRDVASLWLRAQIEQVARDLSPGGELRVRKLG
jgi:DNA-binding transcriptional LysR family regulator